MPSQKLLDDLEAIMYRNRQMKRRQELFDADPTCGTCRKPIDKVENCSNIRLADGTEFLSHDGCFRVALDRMVTRYMGQPRSSRRLL